MNCLECDNPAAYKKAQLCRSHYMKNYDSIRRVPFEEWDKEDFWQFVKQQLKLS